MLIFLRPSRTWVEHAYSLPRIDLTKKESRFAWTSAHQVAFETLKSALLSAPILRTHDPTRRCFVYANASDFAIGAVLTQGLDSGSHSIAFESHKLHGPELNYDALTKEFLAIRFAATKFRSYLHNPAVDSHIFYTDHQSLQFLDQQTSLTGKFLRWCHAILNAIGPFHIRYHPGKDIAVADALSRRPDHRQLFLLQSM